MEYPQAPTAFLRVVLLVVPVPWILGSSISESSAHQAYWPTSVILETGGRMIVESETNLFYTVSSKPVRANKTKNSIGYSRGFMRADLSTPEFKCHEPSLGTA